MDSTIGLMYKYLQSAAKLTSPKAPLPIALIGSKSSTPNLDLFNLKNSVSLVACCCRLSSFYNYIKVKKFLLEYLICMYMQGSRFPGNEQILFKHKIYIVFGSTYPTRSLFSSNKGFHHHGTDNYDPWCRILVVWLFKHRKQVYY